jgi:general secretion pathway protein L
MRGAQTVAVVAAHALSWHLVTLPLALARTVLSPRSDAARVRAILSGVLEESLLDEAQDLHLACFAPSGTPQALWVAVCNRQWLHSACQALEQAGHPVTRIVAECAPTQGDAESYCVITRDLEPARLVVGNAQGISVMPLGEVSLQWSRAGENTRLLAEPAVAEIAEKALGQAVQVQTRAERLLQAAASPWNLAQLELKSSPGERLKKQTAALWQSLLHAPQWRWSRWTAAALVLLHVGAINALAWKEARSIAAQKNAVRAVLQETFPEVGLIIDAPVQMQRQLSLLAQSRGAGAAVPLSGALTALSTQLPEGKAATALELSGDTLQLSGLELTPQETEALGRALSAQGWDLRAQGPLPGSPWQMRRKEAP